MPNLEKTIAREIDVAASYPKTLRVLARHHEVRTIPALQAKHGVRFPIEWDIFVYPAMLAAYTAYSMWNVYV